jgi:hypothetical protein
MAMVAEAEAALPVAMVPLLDMVVRLEETAEITAMVLQELPTQVVAEVAVDAQPTQRKQAVLVVLATQELRIGHKEKLWNI